MAVDRLRYLLQQDIRFRAAELASESSQLLRDGKQEEAEAKLGDVKATLDKTGAVDAATDEYLSKLRELGLEQPPIDVFGGTIFEAGSVIGHSSVIPAEALSLPLASTGVAATQTEPRPQENRVPLRTQLERFLTPAFEKRSRNDLKVREERIAFALFAVNSERTDFAFGSVDQIMDFAFTERDAPSQGQILYNRRYQIRNAAPDIINKLKDAEAAPQEVPPILAKFIEWLTRQPEYENLDMSDLAAIANREISFEEVRRKAGLDAEASSNPDAAGTERPVTSEQGEKVDRKLNSREIVLIADALLATEPEVLAGIGITLEEGDLRQIRAIRGRAKEGDMSTEQALEARETLLKKMFAFVEDPEESFLANTDNEDAQSVLATFAGIESEDGLVTILTTVV